MAVAEEGVDEEDEEDDDKLSPSSSYSLEPCRHVPSAHEDEDEAAADIPVWARWLSTLGLLISVGLRGF